MERDSITEILEVLTEENYVKQVKAFGAICPNCRSKDSIVEDDGAFTLGDFEIEVEYSCKECNNAWIEKYILTGYYGLRQK